MSVVKQGSVSVTNGSATVTGSGTSWLGQVSAGNVFALVGEVAYTVASVASDTSLTLTAPYGGTTASGKTYSITRDFTSGGKALLAQGTVSTAGVLNPTLQALEDADSDLSGVTDASTARENLGLGTAATADKQTSPADTTAGALMGVGAGGLLRTPIRPDDFNSIGGYSHFFWPQETDGGVPAMGSISHGGLRTYASGGVWWDIVARKAGADSIFYRASEPASGATDWRELYHTGNILGTVSQSSGYATGAIIERGSNSNGTYVKFADGTLEIIHFVTVDLSTTGTENKTSPFTVLSGAAKSLSYSSEDSIASGDREAMAGLSINFPGSGALTYSISKAYTGLATAQALRVKISGRWY